MKTLLASIAIIVATVFFPSYAMATPHALRVGPSVTDVTIDPGQVVSKRFTVVNRGEKPFELSVRVMPYSVKDGSYDAVFEPLPGRQPVNEWVTIPEINNFEIKPAGYTDVDMQIAVPPGTPAGGYSVAVLATSALTGNPDGGVVAKQRIAHIVYITVSGPVKQEGTVQQAALPWVAFDSLIDLGVLAQNTGGSHERVKGFVVIEDIFGREAYTERVERYVLPGTQRQIDLEWQSPRLFGIYSIDQTASFVGQDYSQSRWIVILSPLFVGLLIIGVLVSVMIGYFRGKRKSRSKR